MSQNAAIDMNAIRQRAHERWLERGGSTGSAEQDWLEAERELAAESRALDEIQARSTSPVARTLTTTLVSTPTAAAARLPPVPRPARPPRSIITRSTSAPTARLLAALVPEASASLRAAGGTGPAMKAPSSGGKPGRR